MRISLPASRGRRQELTEVGLSLRWNCLKTSGQQPAILQIHTALPTMIISFIPSNVYYVFSPGWESLNHDGNSTAGELESFEDCAMLPHPSLKLEKIGNRPSTQEQLNNWFHMFPHLVDYIVFEQDLSTQSLRIRLWYSSRTILLHARVLLAS